GTKTNAIGLAFNNYLATDSLAGPRLLTHQPEAPVTEPAGVAEARLYWSEPVNIDESDLVIVAADASGAPVPFELDTSDEQVTVVRFTGTPGGSDTGMPVPLLLGAYSITVLETATGLTNAPIDGDNDGVAGGEATVLVAHNCLADLTAPFGVIDLSDVDAFVNAFVSGCAP
ncbi:MAG: hypothetical protein AAF297_11430, partial [Planctomycetota bacterium]